MVRKNTAPPRKDNPGQDITKFFDKKATGLPTPFPGASRSGRLADEAPFQTPAAAATAMRSKTPKHLLESYLLSQDVDDGVEVVWAAQSSAGGRLSATAATSVSAQRLQDAAELKVSAAGKPPRAVEQVAQRHHRQGSTASGVTGAAAASSSSAPEDDLKKSLIRAVQVTSRSGGSGSEAGSRGADAAGNSGGGVGGSGSAAGAGLVDLLFAPPPLPPLMPGSKRLGSKGLAASAPASGEGSASAKPSAAGDCEAAEVAPPEVGCAAAPSPAPGSADGAAGSPVHPGAAGACGQGQELAAPFADRGHDVDCAKTSATVSAGGGTYEDMATPDVRARHERKLGLPASASAAAETAPPTAGLPAPSSRRDGGSTSGAAAGKTRPRLLLGGGGADSSHKKPSAGQKRKALMDLLDQVAQLVPRPSPRQQKQQGGPRAAAAATTAAAAVTAADWLSDRQVKSAPAAADGGQRREVAATAEAATAEGDEKPVCSAGATLQPAAPGDKEAAVPPRATTAPVNGHRVAGGAPSVSSVVADYVDFLDGLDDDALEELFTTCTTQQQQQQQQQRESGAVGATTGPASKIRRVLETSDVRCVQQQHESRGAGGQSIAMPATGGQAAYPAATAAADGADGAAAATSTCAPPPLAGEREALHHVVLEVVESCSEKTVRLFSEYRQQELTLHLRHGWIDTPLAAGDTVNVLAEVEVTPDGRRHAMVDCNRGLLVLHPDLLLSGTTVTNALRCTRQAWLQERFSGGSGEKAVVGQLMHELLQKALVAKLPPPSVAGEHGPSGAGTGIDREALLSWARSIVEQSSVQLFEVGLDESRATAMVAEQVGNLLRWLDTYVATGSGGGGGPVQLGDAARGEEAARLAVTGIVDIEENIWAPKYGLKGQLDATLRVRLQRQQGGCGMRQYLQQQQQHQGSKSAAAAVGGERQHHAASAAAPAAGAVGRLQVDARHTWGPGGNGGGQQQQQSPLPEEQVLTVPLEFKSGKDYITHRAQVSLYLLLMEARYGGGGGGGGATGSAQSPPHGQLGLLWNVNQPTVQTVRRVHAEVAGLLQHRNRLAAHLAGQQPSLPPMLQGSPHICARCPAVDICALHHKALEGGTAESSGLGEQFTSLTHHMSATHAAFFRHWAGLLDLEEAGQKAERPQIWAISGADREQAGSCISSLVLLGTELPPECVVASSSASGANRRDAGRNIYVFGRHRSSSSSSLGGGAVSSGQQSAEGLLGLGFAAGDFGVLSVEGQHVALSRVTVAAVSRDTITLTSQKPVRLSKLVPSAVLAAGGWSSPPGRPPALPPGVETLRWRLDRDEVASTFGHMRSNLSRLFTSDGGYARRLRQLVVDLDTPAAGGAARAGSTQQQQAPAAAHRSSGGAVSDGSDVVRGNSYLATASSSMNADQVSAVVAALVARDYALILGMPGTGKTTTIVHAVRALLAAGRTILITSYTNSAVDNILLKLADAGVDFLRLGSAASTHPRIADYTLGGPRYPDTSVAGLRQLAASARVVGTTCLSTHSPFLAHKFFDVCFVDEASQISLPAVLGALMKARTFLLVGDHYQLSPLVASEAAARGGLGVSLFRRLCEAHPGATVALRTQYRMCADIQLLSNSLVYSHALVCGSQHVAQAALELPSLEELGSTAAAVPERDTAAFATGSAGRTGAAPAFRLPDWLRSVLQPERRVVFLDTDACAACREVMLHDAVCNTSEAALVMQIVEGLVAAGACPASIGLVSPYRAQVALLQRSCAEAGLSDQVEALTVDKYQGRDKPVILLSLVRSNSQASAGHLLADWQRLNVALTRAKTKLVLVGSAGTLAPGVPLMGRLISLLRERDWILPLPAAWTCSSSPRPPSGASDSR